LSVHPASAMVNDTMGNKETKKSSRMKLFCQRMCMPLHRALSSYLGITLDEPARNERNWQHENIVDYQQDDTVNYDQPMSLNYTESTNPRQSRSRYRAAPPVHPYSRSSSRQAPSFSYMPGLIVSIRNSLDVDEDIRERTHSPEYDAPRVNGKKRMRRKNEKNKDLPESLRAQPAQSTKTNMTGIDSGTSNTRLVDQIPNASASSRHAAWYPWNTKNDRSRHSNGDSSRHRSGSQPRSQSQRSSKESSRQPSRLQPHVQSQGSKGTVCTPYSGKVTKDTSSTSPPSSACCTTARLLRMNEADHGNGTMPTNIKPLRDDTEHVLWRSPSRGFMVLRRMLSLEALRETANLRTPVSLVGAMEELYAKKEMSGEWFGVDQNGVRWLIICVVELKRSFKADARRVPVAHRTHKSSLVVCESDVDGELFPQGYSVN
jgi:hypothetical protein